jgi:hypothetical protein
MRSTLSKNSHNLGRSQFALHLKTAQIVVKKHIGHGAWGMGHC